MGGMPLVLPFSTGAKTGQPLQVPPRRFSRLCHLVCFLTSPSTTSSLHRSNCIHPLPARRYTSYSAIVNLFWLRARQSLQSGPPSIDLFIVAIVKLVFALEV